jgi:hypothetical protein
MDLLKEIVCDERCRGRRIKDQSKLILLAACNPLRKMKDNNSSKNNVIFK